jgi:hypothetical protein
LWVINGQAGQGGWVMLPLNTGSVGGRSVDGGSLTLLLAID